MKIFLSLSAVAIALVACSKMSCACSPPLDQAIVWGQVTMDTGGPAPRAAMLAEAVPTLGCVRDTLFAWGGADSLGRYRLAVFGAGISDSGCVFVGARFPAQGANARDTVLGPFRLKFATQSPFDSANVNLVIRH